MRRTAGILAIAGCMMLAGCGESRVTAEPEKLGPEWSGTAKLTMEGREYKARLRHSGEVWEMVMTEPETVAGLTFTGQGESCVMSLGDVSWTADSSLLPEYGAFPLLTESLDMLFRGDVSSVREGDELTETGVVRGMDMTAGLRDGELMSLTVEGCLSAEFE